MRKFADAHCDTATQLTWRELALGCPPEQAHLDLPRLREHMQLQFMAFFLEKLSPTAAWAALRQHLQNLRRAAAEQENVKILPELSQAGQGQTLQLVLAVEGLGLLAEDWLAGVEELLCLGFRSFGLFWNNDNWLGCGAAAAGWADKGLTAAGRDFVAYGQEHGLLLDLAHASRQSFWQAAEIDRRPLFVSHACCAAICPHKRNLTDGQLRKIGDSGGWLGVALVPDFLRPKEQGQAGLADAARHMQYAVNLAGEDAVGLGSDFDGVEALPLGIEGVQSLPCLAEALTAAGMKPAQVDKLMGGNLLRFLREFK